MKVVIIIVMDLGKKHQAGPRRMLERIRAERMDGAGVRGHTVLLCSTAHHRVHGPRRAGGAFPSFFALYDQSSSLSKKNDQGAANTFTLLAFSVSLGP